MIYLASVYSYRANPVTMHRRYSYALKRTATFLKANICVFCPIAHCHNMSLQHDMPRSWDFWKELDFSYLRAAKELWVLKMPHWEESVGITAEIKFAKKLGIPIKYVSCDDYTEGEG